MLKVKYILAACAVALTLSSSAFAYGNWSGYCGTKTTLLYCQDGVCYYTDGASFTNPDGSHVLSASGVVPQ